MGPVAVDGLYCPRCWAARKETTRICLVIEGFWVPASMSIHFFEPTTSEARMLRGCLVGSSGRKAQGGTRHADGKDPGEANCDVREHTGPVHKEQSHCSVNSHNPKHWITPGASIVASAKKGRIPGQRCTLAGSSEQTKSSHHTIDRHETG